jgi:Notch-like protein
MKKIQKSSNKCKATWDIIKQLTNNQHSQPDIQELIIDSKHLSDQQDITDAFSNYFLSVIDKISKRNVNNTINNAKVPTFYHYLERNYNYSPPSLVIKTFSTKEITSIIKALKTKNSHGFDEISMKLLKISAAYICSPLTYIYNKSILSGTFPDRMKFLIIKPIFKKGNKMNLTNYRPISLLTSFSKVFETALFNRLTAHFNTNKLLNLICV